MVGLYSCSFRNGDTLKTDVGQMFMLDKHSEQKQGWRLKFLLLQSDHYQLNGNRGERFRVLCVCVCAHMCVCLQSFFLPSSCLVVIASKG